MSVKPRILCPQCGASLQTGSQFCPACGVALDWTASASQVKIQDVDKVSEVVRRKQKLPSQKSAISWMAKSVLGIILIGAVAVVVFEFTVSGHSSSELVKKETGTTEVQANTVGQNQAEINALESNVTAHPEDMTLTLQLANLLHDSFLYSRAIPYYKKYLEKKKSDANARVDLGICYKELGNFSEAKKEMKQALTDVPGHLYANFNLGIVCLSEGNIEESNEWLKKTVALDPSSEVGKRAQQILTQHNSQTPKKNK